MKSLQGFVDNGSFYKSVVDDGSDIVFVADYEGRILYHNSSVKELGYQPNSLIGKNFFDFILPETLVAFKKAYRNCTRQAFSEAIEFQFLTQAKTFKHFEFNSINLWHKEGIDGLILDCRDITQRKKVAEELLVAQKTKDLFLANISHEIRTPINGISGMASLLSQHHTPQERATYLKAIKRAADNLKVIINDILDLASIESGKIKFEKIDFNLHDLLDSLIDTFSAQVKEKGIQLRLNIAPEADKVFVGDPVRLNQILTNLVSNALKFTHQGFISIRCGIEKQAPRVKHIKFEVEDNGIGIPSDKLTTIFESFSQADPSITRKYGGTGLGLTIVKQLIDLQHGRISVVSKENQGSTFIVVLPYPLAKTPSIARSGRRSRAVTQDPSTLDQLSVLLVEDNEINRLYAGSILKKWNCRVEMAENGLIAVEKLKNQTFDLILMDIQMPVMDGYEATRTIRSGRPPASQIPIIALTANSAEKDVEKCLREGMNECISKPFTPEELFIRLQKFKPDKVNLMDHQADSQGSSTTNSVINLNYLRNASHNDADFVQSMVRAMVASFPGNILDIKQQVTRKDWTKLAQSVHRLKSSLAMIGMEDTRRDASLIEDLAFSHTTDRIPKLALGLCEALDRALAELRIIDPTNDPVSIPDTARR